MAAPLRQMPQVVDLEGRRRRLEVVPDKPVPDPPTPADTQPGALSRAWTALAGDARHWWGLHTDPPTLSAWLAARTPHRVPDDRRLRAAWHVDHWATGLPLLVLSMALFGSAATVRWVACHPARRWVFLTLLITYVAWITQA